MQNSVATLERIKYMLNFIPAKCLFQARLIQVCKTVHIFPIQAAQNKFSFTIYRAIVQD
jgi:hypothetical protein